MKNTIKLPDTPLNRVWCAQNLSGHNSFDWTTKTTKGMIIVTAVNAQQAFEIAQTMAADGIENVSTNSNVLTLSSNMKTVDMNAKLKTLVLPEEIKTIFDAKKFLKYLNDNGVAYHCEDDATDCLECIVSHDDAQRMNKLMNDIYALPGNENAQTMIFDPCGYLLILDDDYRANSAIESLREVHHDSPIGHAIQNAIKDGSTKTMLELLNELHTQMGVNPGMFKEILSEQTFNEIQSLHL